MCKGVIIVLLAQHPLAAVKIFFFFGGNRNFRDKQQVVEWHFIILPLKLEEAGMLYKMLQISFEKKATGIYFVATSMVN